MAAIQPAIDRIAHLLGEGRYRATPAPLNGSRASVRSYALPIVSMVNSDVANPTYCVTNQRSSPTTNRHVRAAHAAMEQLGYVKVGVTDLGTLYRKPE